MVGNLSSLRCGSPSLSPPNEYAHATGGGGRVVCVQEEEEQMAELQKLRQQIARHRGHPSWNAAVQWSEGGRRWQQTGGLYVQ